MNKQKEGMLIRDGHMKDSQTLRARDVEFELRGVDVHPKVASLLARLSESNHINTKDVAEMAVMLNSMVEIVVGMTTVAENLKNATEQLTRRQADVDDTITTQ